MVSYKADNWNVIVYLAVIEQTLDKFFFLPRYTCCTMAALCGQLRIARKVLTAGRTSCLDHVVSFMVSWNRFVAVHVHQRRKNSWFQSKLMLMITEQSTQYKLLTILFIHIPHTAYIIVTIAYFVF